jgi:DNA-binding beta-propeller fold protein YncE
MQTKVKSAKNLACIAATLLCLIVFATASFAATPTLSLPRGLAVDSKGNLWVANSAGNNILVYSPSYVLQKSKTITTGISDPWGVAFDHWGNPWVANNGNSSVTEYPSGLQSPTTTLTNGITNPQALAFDATGNLWVQNNGTNLIVYVPTVSFSIPADLVQTITPGEPIYGLALGAGSVALGTPTDASVTAKGYAIKIGQLGGSMQVGQSTGFAIACDASGKFYIANLDGSVQTSVPSQSIYGNGSLTTSAFLQLSFAPSGIAVDSVHGRVYFSNYDGNSISVYSTSGTFLHLIQ